MCFIIGVITGNENKKLKQESNGLWMEIVSRIIPQKLYICLYNNFL